MPLSATSATHVTGVKGLFPTVTSANTHNRVRGLVAIGDGGVRSSAGTAGHGRGHAQCYEQCMGYTQAMHRHSALCRRDNTTQPTRMRVGTAALVSADVDVDVTPILRLVQHQEHAHDACTTATLSTAL